MTVEQRTRGVSRIIELAKLFTSLSAGAILLIATFLRDPPAPSGSKWVVLTALLSFSISFWAFLRAVFFAMNAEYRLLQDEMYVEAGKKFMRWHKIGQFFFTLGIISMLALAVRVVLSWP